MTKISLLTLVLLSVAAPSFAQSGQDNYDYEAARLALADMRCDINDERRLRWEAMDQEVILRTQLIKDSDAGLPIGHLSIVLENGTEIDLGSGQKYYDDGPIEEMLDCQKHLAQAVEMTAESLLVPKPQRESLKSLLAYIDYGKTCTDPQSALDEQKAGYDCYEASFLGESFAEGQPQSGLSRQALDALGEAGAPLITINRSAYYSETAVYDARSNKIHVLFYEGC